MSLNLLVLFMLFPSFPPMISIGFLASAVDILKCNPLSQCLILFVIVGKRGLSRKFLNTFAMVI